MIVFIDDRPIRLVGPKAAVALSNRPDFDRVLDARLEILKDSALQGHLLIVNATPPTIEKLLLLLTNSDISHLLSVTLLCVDSELVEERLKMQFKIIKAAGGVVSKNAKILLMFRRGVWDLPKGKVDPGESSKRAAIREVLEETGVKAKLGDRICTTWHTYTQNGNRILKRTKWYRMTAIDDSKMAPQEAEDIEQLAWMDARQTQVALTNSFSSIRYVLEQTNKTTKSLGHQ